MAPWCIHISCLERVARSGSGRDSVRGLVGAMDAELSRPDWLATVQSGRKQVQSRVCTPSFRNISTFYSVSEQPIGGTTGRTVARPVARLIVRPLTIWNSRFQFLNMTIDLVATDLPLAITHDLCDQSYDLCDQSYDRSTIGPPFQHLSIAGRS